MSWFTNQKHVKNFQSATVAQAEALTNIREPNIHFVKETNKIYYYADWSVATIDWSNVLNANWWAGRWLSVTAPLTKLTRYYWEEKAVTDWVAVLPALNHLGTHWTVKVINLCVYLNWTRQNNWAANDYTYNEINWVITFNYNLVWNDVVLVDYDSQDA